MFIQLPTEPAQLNLPARLQQTSSPHRQIGRIGRIKQRLLRQMRIALGGFDLGVPQKLLHFVERSPGVD